MTPYPHPSPFGLAIPASSSAGPSTQPSRSASFQSSPGTQPKPKRNRKPKIPRSSRGPGLDLERALDENDDIDIEKDLEAAPGKRDRVRREVDEDYDEEEDGDSEDGEGEEGDEEEGEGEAGGVEAVGTGVDRPDGAGGKTRAGGDGGRGKGKGKERENGEGDDTLKRKRERLGQVEVDGKEVERRNKKRKEDGFLLRNHMDTDQARRFDAFQTVVLPKQAIKRLNREMFDQSCNTTLAAIIAGLGKVFVAEVIEIAKDLQPTSKYPAGPLRPYHLRLARMELEQRGLLSPNGTGASRGGSALKPSKAIHRR